MTSHIRLRNGQLFDPLGGDQMPPRWVFTRALAMINRYTGHTSRPYSVAEHTRLLARSPEVEAAGLSRAAALHDFSEAMFNDIARPVKYQLPQYTSAEMRFQRRIFQHWNEPWENIAKLGEYDHRICVSEMLVLFDNVVPWTEPLKVTVPTSSQPWEYHYLALEEVCDQLGIAA